MVTLPTGAFKEAIDKEPQYVRIPVELSGKDLKDVRRILEGKFEPAKDAWLVVKVKEKKE